MKEQMTKIFAAIDRKDTDAFVSFLSDDAIFRFANAPVVRNKEDIRKVVILFLSNIKSSRHRVLGVWQEDNIVICEGEVIYTRHNGSELTLPFVDILRMRGDLITDYRVYIDISPL